MEIQEYPFCVISSISIFARNAQAFYGSERVNDASSWFYISFKSVKLFGCMKIITRSPREILPDGV